MASFQSPPPSTIIPASPLRISQACDDGKTFAELFYEKMDKQRHAMVNLFHESASLVWNGNHIQGKSAVVSFLEQLPVSETELTCIDAQPVLDLPALGGQQTITVICGGRQKHGNNKYKHFTESFMLTAEQNVWKVVSDTYRNFE